MCCEKCSAPSECSVCSRSHSSRVSDGGLLHWASYRYRVGLRVGAYGHHNHAHYRLHPRKTWLIVGDLRMCIFVCSHMILLLLIQWFRKGGENEACVYNGVCGSVVRNSAPSGCTFWTPVSCALCFLKQQKPVSRWQVTLLYFLWIFPGSAKFTTVSAGAFLLFQGFAGFSKVVFPWCQGCE